MDVPRRSMALRLALLACLVGIGWWMRPDEAPNPSQMAVQSPLPEQAPAHRLRDAATKETAPESSEAAPATFRGRVIDAVTREPIREFELKFAATQRTDPGVRKFRSEEGRFEWKDLPPGKWTVRAEATGYQRFDLVDLTLVEGGATAELVLPLRAGHIVRGRVYDRASQAGIASASIAFREAGTARFEGNWRSRPRVESGKDGSFVLKGVPPGRVTLEVSANDYASRELIIVVAADTPAQEIALSSGGTIAGRLTAADGVTPVQGYASMFRLDQHFGGSVPTSETGEFSFSHLSPGRYRITGQVASGSVTRDFELHDEERIEGIVLAFGTGRTIRGTVTGLRPAELKTLYIAVERPETFAFPGEPAKVNERGEYELPGVQPGRVYVTAGLRSGRQTTRAVDVTASADLTVNFDFPRGVRLSEGCLRGRAAGRKRCRLPPESTGRRHARVQDGRVR